MKYLLLIGNGLSIDFIRKNELSEKIDLVNLFAKGDRVHFPGLNLPGFLSPKYCKNLWTLGARPNMKPDECLSLIEDIITCANVLNKNMHITDGIYSNAYAELQVYLKSLFIYYNERIEKQHIESKSWVWAKFLDRLYKNEEVEKIIIISLNYDIILERVLSANNIDFVVSGFENGKTAKVEIYKPHGSISFTHKVQRDAAAYEINYALDSNDGNLVDFKQEFTNLKGLDAVNAIVPPAGDSSRLDFAWAKEIRARIQDALKTIAENDVCIACGISYWHVDRLELDRILTSIPQKIKEFNIINPNPPNAFLAVASTLFPNTIAHTNAEILESK